MNTIFGKFVKGFITGGLAALTGAVSLGVSFHSISELSGVVSVLIIAFLSGGVHAIFNMAFPATTA